MANERSSEQSGSSCDRVIGLSGCIGVLGGDWVWLTGPSKLCSVILPQCAWVGFPWVLWDKLDGVMFLWVQRNRKSAWLLSWPFVCRRRAICFPEEKKIRNKANKTWFLSIRLVSLKTQRLNAPKNGIPHKRLPWLVVYQTLSKHDKIRWYKIYKLLSQHNISCILA